MVDMALITVREASERSGLHPNTIRNWLRSGLIRSFRIVPKGQIFIKDKELDRLVERMGHMGESEHLYDYDDE